MDNAIQLIAGSIGGAAGIIFGHPLDVVKVRMQSQSSPFSSSLQCFLHILREEKFLGLYRGMAPPLVSVALYQSICFASYNFAMKRLNVRCLLIVV